MNAGLKKKRSMSGELGDRETDRKGKREKRTGGRQEPLEEYEAKIANGWRGRGRISVIVLSKGGGGKPRNGSVNAGGTPRGVVSN